MAKECPHCKLIVPPETGTCDCGYEFNTGRIGSSLDPNFHGGLGIGESIIFLLGFFFIPYYFIVIYPNRRTRPTRAKQAVIMMLCGILINILLALIRVFGTLGDT